MNPYQPWQEVRIERDQTIAGLAARQSRGAAANPHLGSVVLDKGPDRRFNEYRSTIHELRFIMSVATVKLNQLIETRTRILDAAREVVALSGWKDAQIALIASRAGVATGSVYRYFDSKADLYAQVLGQVSEREVAVVAAIVEAGGSASQCLVDAIYTFSMRAMRGRRLAYAMIAEPCEPEIDAARLKYRAALADQIARLIKRGIASGEFIRIDVNVAASCVTGAFMEALVGPLAPEADPDSRAAKAIAQSIAGLAARMMFRLAAPELKLVSKGSA
jgi:AcrR family transcriptional regulator